MNELNAYQIIRHLLQDTAVLTGEPFLRASAQSFATHFKADFVFITKALEAPPQHVRMLAAWRDGSEIEGWDFALPGTPCELIYRNDDPDNWEGMRSGSGVNISEDVCRIFASTRDTSYESFIGVPLWSRDREMIGHVAVFFKRRINDPGEQKLLLELVELFSYKIQAELNRMFLEQAKEKVLADLQEANDRLLRDSTTDSLTSLYNRRYFTLRANEAFARYQRSGDQFALLLIDVDHFKSINDLHGHSVGDNVLRSLAAVLRDTTRAAELVFRIGGEEFAVLCHGPSTAKAMKGLAERINLAIRNLSIPLQDGSFSVTVSLGATQPAPTDTSWDDVFRRADKALYAAKAGGRDRAVIAHDQQE
jgi:two-component system cell cycle response regulator